MCQWRFLGLSANLISLDIASKSSPTTDGLVLTYFPTLAIFDGNILCYRFKILWRFVFNTRFTANAPHSKWIQIIIVPRFKSLCFHLFILILWTECKLLPIHLWRKHILGVNFCSQFFYWKKRVSVSSSSNILIVYVHTWLILVKTRRSLMVSNKFKCSDGDRIIFYSEYFAVELSSWKFRTKSFEAGTSYEGKFWRYWGLLQIQHGFGK